MKKCIYQIYYEHDQLNKLSKYTIPYYNQSLSPFFENDVILKLYNDNVIENCDYFGVLSWRIESKNKINLEILNTLSNEFDMYVFKNIVTKHHVLKLSNQYHPLFGKLFEKCLNNINLDYKNFYNEVMLGLYQNAIIASKDVYLDYVKNFLQPTVNFIKYNTDIEFQSLVRRDPLYSSYPPGMRDRLKRTIGTPYYQYHTFLCERLWSIYYHINKSNLRLKIL